MNLFSCNKIETGQLVHRFPLNNHIIPPIYIYTLTEIAKQCIFIGCNWVITEEIKLRMFQFKIIHNTVFINDRLFKAFQL